MKTYSTKSIILCIGILFLGNTLFAQSFTKITDSPLVSDGAESEGCAWGDFDDDGDEDLIITNGLMSAQNNMLFLNEGSDSNYIFNPVMESIIVNDGAGSRAASWGDYDNDGDLDLLVANQYELWNDFLYQNNGDSTFTQMSHTPVTKDYNKSDPGGWIDYDNDGFLDILVGNPDPGWSLNNMYHNDGNGIFKKIRTGPIPQGNTKGFAWGDYDNDGDEDLFTIEADGNRFLFNNDGNGYFTKVTGSVVTDESGGSPGMVWVDYDNDGDWDLHIVDDGIYINQGADGEYEFMKDESENLPICDGHSSSWSDFDNDGDIDCYVNWINHSSCLYSNNGDGSFTQITEGDIVTDNSGSVSCAWADYDNDGDMDLYVCNTFNQNNNFYRNDNNNGNSWIKIKLIGVVSNATAIGAKIRVKANTGAASIWQMRAIEGQSSMVSQNSLIAHFGLGSATQIDSIVVQWPAGHETVLMNVNVNRQITLPESIPDGFIKARFNTDTTYGPGSLTVQFTDFSLTNESDTVNSWSWDFNNDGIVDSYERNPLHTYNSIDGKNFDVALAVSNGIKTDSVIKKEYIMIYPENGNLALWGKGTASSSYYNFPVIYANNDEIETGWMSEKRPDSEWLTIELDTTYTVGKVVMHWYAEWRVSHYAILTSMDNTNWDTVYCESNGTGAEDTLLFTGIDAKFVQVLKFPDPSKEIFVKEMEIFRSDGNTYPVEICDPVEIENSVLKNLNPIIYPNPVENTINIEFNQPQNQNIVVELTDITGRIHKNLVLISGSNRTAIDVSDLVEGLYILIIRYNNKVYNSKILIY